MHDDLIERRLRAVLRDEADRLPFTITAAELQRRATLRGRGAGSRRLTLLLAAAVAIGALGTTALLGALSDRPQPSPIAQATQDPGTTQPASAEVPKTLPSLDELITRNRAPILVAQAQGPADGPPEPISETVAQKAPIVGLGDIQGNGEYVAAVACLGSSPLEVELRPAGSSTALDGPTFVCDGIVHEATIRIAGAASVSITYNGPTSWRVAIRGDRGALPLPTASPVLSPFNEGWEELVRLDDATVDAGADGWGSRGLRVREIGAVPARVDYMARVWCEAGGTLDLLFANPVSGVLTPSIETQLACDGLVHDLALWIPQANGSTVLVASEPSTRWSVLILAGAAPLSLVQDIPEWQPAGGIGPSLHFESIEVSFSDVAGQDGGPLMVVVECVGEARDIAVNVDLDGILGDAFQTYTARCAPVGGRTTFRFDTGPTGYIVRQEAPAGTWTAMTVLIPDPQND